MADVAITAASVVKGSGATVTVGTAGTTITAGQTLYADAANSSVLKLADADASAATAAAVGIALHGSLSGQPIAYCSAGPLTVGGTLVAGKMYAVSATAGGICPVADLTTGAQPCYLGYASSTTVLQVSIVSTGVTL